MNVYGDIISLDSSAAALGFFDGVHLGHQKLVSNLVNFAKQNGEKSVIVTFSNSPAGYFVNNPEYLTNNTEKEEILSELGVDYVIELNFDERLMDMTAIDYLKFLHENIHPVILMTGFNHAFGKNKTGNPEFLKQHEHIFGYKYYELQPVKSENEIISSTAIKKYLKNGEIKRANELSGRKFKLTGTVIKGRQLGRTIGFPTANILYPKKKVKIPFGVYCCEVIARNKKYKGILNYGIKPTIDGKNSPLAEVHIIGFDNDIYGQNIDILIENRIRDEKKFDSLETLQAQIREDIKKC
ncbi:MAG: bifunctional riboflavin kinase/FAD synthetase [Candidatus Gastranaerophilales bacterium]|nr:bifunctional riboflavin kinase/FAD synthetase [Candidatus Gastranaerophilales bacterium]